MRLFPVLVAILAACIALAKASKVTVLHCAIFTTLTESSRLAHFHTL